jgi:hypothetical protein
MKKYKFKNIFFFLIIILYSKMEIGIFKIKSYKSKNNKNPVIYGSINDLCKYLSKNNEGCHLRIKPDKFYTLYIDIDGYKKDITDFFMFFNKFMDEYYDVKINDEDYSYTKNYDKEGSYHISIPKYYCQATKMKEIIINFKKIFAELIDDQNNNVIDTSVYGNQFYRLPYQSKEQDEKKIHHVIKSSTQDNKGIIDFINEYIPENSININSKCFRNIKLEDNVQIKEKEKDDKEVINKLIDKNYTDNNFDWDLIDPEKLEDRNNWLIFASCLKALNYDYNFFCNISKKSKNHDKCTCQLVFESVSEEMIKNPIKTLWSFAKRKKCLSDNFMDIIFYFSKNYYLNEKELYEDIKLYFKDNIYFIMEGNTYNVVIKKNYSHDDDTKIYEMCKYTTFLNNYKTKCFNFYVENKLMKSSIFNILPNLEYLNCKGIIMKPYHPFENETKLINGYLNIFSPMIAKKVNNYDVNKIQIILNHIKEVWANNDDFIYKYILTYFHQIFKTPWDRHKIALVVCGEMGTGKSIVLEMMIKHIFGTKCGHHTQGLKSICSKFQGWMENKLFILSEEPTKMSEMNFSEYVEKLKDFITADTNEIEKKGLEKYTINSYHSLVITCNHLKGINVPNENERRFFIIGASNKYMGNFDYFKKLHQCLDNKECMDILFSYLYDYEDIVPLHPIPITDLKRELIEENKSLIERFLFDEENSLKINTKESTNLTILYNDFIVWYDRNGLNKNYKMKKFAFDKEMAKYGISKIMHDKVTKEKKRIFCFNDDVIKKLDNLYILCPNNYSSYNFY